MTEKTVETADQNAEKRRENAEFSFIDEFQDNPYNNVFVESLATITQDELGAPPEKKKRTPQELFTWLLGKVIFWGAVAAFFISGYQVVYKLYAYRQADNIYSDIADSVFSENTLERDDIVSHALKSKKTPSLTPVNGVRAETEDEDDTESGGVYNERFEMMKGQLTILQRKSPEVIGWIRMEGDTQVNYPIVQHEDNDYYLHYAYDGTYNPAGSIFLDYLNNTAVGENRHAILYGHNMESGSPMFANLLHYQDPGYWDNNRYIDIYMPNALYTYEVFAAYETDPSQTVDENHSWRMSFNHDDTVFLKWIAHLKERSDISPDVEVKASDRILTLSTCTNMNDQRYVVHAKLIEVVS